MRLPVGRLVALFAVSTVLPLVLLSYLSTRLASDAVGREVEARMSSTASITAELVAQELDGLADLVESYAERPHLLASMGSGARPRYDRSAIELHLRELRRARPGIYTAFLAAPDGELVGIVPRTPGIVGKDYGFRDWYKGVTARRATYVSEAYQTQARGHSLVVAVATPVFARRDGDGRSSGRVLAILVAAYSLAHIQHLSDRLGVAQDVKLKVTDQRGVLIASPGEAPEALVSRRDDPRVAAALRGRSGVTTLGTPDGHRLSAYAPVPPLGWTVTASVPADTALAAVGKLRSAVFTIAALLGLVFIGGLALLARTLRARKRAEEAAQRQTSITRAVLDATVDGITMTDVEGNLLIANARVEELAHEVVGQRLEDIDRSQVADLMVDPETYRAAEEATASDPERTAIDEFQLAASGRSFQRYTAPVRDASGALLGRISILREVTAEREAERVKSELVATVSHELRTPLASILGFAELLADRDPDGPTRERYLRTIHNEAKRLTNLVNDFLDLQRMEEGSFRLAVAPFDMGELLAEQVELFSGQSSAHTLELDLPDDPLQVAGDPDRVAQVVGNLVSNAVKYSPSGGTVEVGAARTNGVVRVSVRDPGLGIPADQQRHLFTKFFRVDSSDTREIGGTGLGLALCRQIVEAHGGRIGFESVEREGSTFWFELPAAHGRTHHRGQRVVVIEDDAAAASLLRALLEADGYAVETAASGETGIALAERDPPALVCLDIGLAGELDGWDVLARLKASPATEAVPVIICTAGNGRDKAVALGAADFLTKPFSARQLRETIARLLPDERGTVLIVDDEDAVRALIAETLGGDGLELVEAADGDEALAAVAARKPDAIVLDLMMPRLDGFSVLERLQDDPSTRPIPVVVLTARRLSAEERASLKERAVSLLEKSDYSAAELRRLVNQALGPSAVR